MTKKTITKIRKKHKTKAKSLKTQPLVKDISAIEISPAVLFEDLKRLATEYKSLNFLASQIRKLKKEKISFKDLTRYFRLAVLFLLDEIKRIIESRPLSGKLTAYPEKTLKEKESEIAALKGNLKSLKTDYDNLKSRAEKLSGQNISKANEQMVLKLLPVVDNFDMAIKSASSTTDINSVAKGIAMIFEQMNNILNKEGLKEIEAEGKLFDPNIHEVICETQTDKVPEYTVLEVVRRGYLWHNNLLRPATVKIAKKSQ